jgi:hypothetical protein
MNKRTCIIVFLALLMCACASTQQVRDELQKAWEGRSVNDLVAELGPPTQVLDDGRGGKIYSYSTSKTFHSGSSSFSTYQGQRQGDYYQTSKGYVPGNSYTGNAYTFSAPGASFTRSQHRMFWVNDQGIIVRVEYQKTKGR